MNNEEVIENLQARLNILSSVMVEMFKVVAIHLPSTNDSFIGITKQWEEAEIKFPLPKD